MPKLGAALQTMIIPYDALFCQGGLCGTGRFFRDRVQKRGLNRERLPAAWFPVCEKHAPFRRGGACPARAALPLPGTGRVCNTHSALPAHVFVRRKPCPAPSLHSPLFTLHSSLSNRPIPLLRRAPPPVGGVPDAPQTPPRRPCSASAPNIPLSSLHSPLFTLHSPPLPSLLSFSTLFNKGVVLGGILWYTVFVFLCANFEKTESEKSGE